MKQKNLFFFFTLTLAIVSFSVYPKSVKVKFCNKTLKTIDSLVVDSIFIGSILPDSCSNYFEFNDFPFDGGAPDPIADAVIEGKKYTTDGFRKCGSECFRLESGEFNFYILIDNIRQKQFLTFGSNERIPFPWQKE